MKVSTCTVIATALITLCPASRTDESEEKSPYPGFRPECERAAAFVSDAKTASTVVFPTIIRTPTNTSFSAESQQQIVSFLNENKVTRAAADKRELSPGELKGRVILEGPGRGAVLTRTGEAIAVPAGTYSQPTVYLDGGAKFLRFTARGSQQVNVTEGGSLDLTLGGPLQNAARVQSSGGSVRFDYELRGVGGERYKAFINDFTQKPKLAVYRGDEKVHSANFEYG